MRSSPASAEVELTSLDLELFIESRAGVVRAERRVSPGAGLTLTLRAGTDVVL